VVFLLQGLPTKTLNVPLLSLIYTTCPALLTLLDLIAQIIFGKQYFFELASDKKTCKRPW